MTQEANAKIGDYVTAEMVDCAEPVQAPDVPLPRAPEGQSQSQQIAQATIEQTGADPPPARSQETSLHPPEQRERHPIAQDPPQPTIESLVTELFHLKCLTAQLWDQVWWLSLPDARRADYQRQGFRDPIQQFYWPYDGGGA